MFRLIKQEFIALLSFSGSLTTIANISNFKTCISLNNQPLMTRLTLIDLNSDEYNQGLCYYQFAVILLDIIVVVIQLMIPPVEYLQRIKQKI